MVKVVLNDRVTLRQIRLAVMVADQGSVVRAAEHLHVTQPVVTRGILDLERVLGVELFHRGPKGMSPTVFGEVFLDHARAVLAHLQQAERHVNELADASVGTVTVGTHLAGSNLLLPRAIAGLKAERPQVTVVVREATPDLLTAELLSGDLDLVVGRLTPDPSARRLDQMQLYAEPIRLVTRPEHPAQRLAAPRLKDLLAYPWILPVEQTALRHELEGVLRRHQLPLPDNRIECTSLLTLRTLVMETDVVAVLPFLIADADPQLAVLSTPLEQITRMVGVTLPTERRPSPSAALLLRHLQATAATIRAALRRGAGFDAVTTGALRAHPRRPAAMGPQRRAQSRRIQQVDATPVCWSKANGVESFGRGLPTESHSWPAVERGGDGVEVAAVVSGEVGAFGQVVTQQAIGRSCSLSPGAGGIGPDGGLDPSVQASGHFALDGAPDVAVSLAFGGAAGLVGAGLGVASYLVDGDCLQGTVQGPVAATVEAVSAALSTAGLERSDSGQ